MGCRSDSPTDGLSIAADGSLIVTKTWPAQSAKDRLRATRDIQALSQIVGEIAHELNNRLAVMICNLELLEESDLTESVLRRLVEPSLRSALGSAELTNQLLTLTRRRAGRVHPVDLGDLIEETLPLLRQVTSGSGSIDAIGSPGLWRCAVDPDTLENSLIDFVTNHRTHFPHKTDLKILFENISLAANDAEGLPPGDYVALTIEDGRGLVAEDIFFCPTLGGHVRVGRTEGSGVRVEIFFPRAPDGRESGAEPEMMFA